MKTPLNPSDYEVNNGDLAVKSPDPQQSPFESFKTEAIPHPETGELLRRLDVGDRDVEKLCHDCEFNGLSTGCTAPSSFHDSHQCTISTDSAVWSFIWVPVPTSGEEVTP